MFKCVFFRPQYYKVIEECVAQIVLHRSGMDPDFGYRERLEVDFTQLIGKLSIATLSLAGTFQIL